MKLARFAFLLVLLSGGLVAQVMSVIPQAQAGNPVTGALFINSINLAVFDWWDYFPFPNFATVYFQVTYHGIVDTGTRDWSGCQVDQVVQYQWVSTRCQDQQQFDFDVLSGSHSVTIDFAVYKDNNPLTSWFAGHKLIFHGTYNFPLGDTPDQTLGDKSTIQFRVRTQIILPTNNVIVYAEPHQTEGSEPFPANDLHAYVAVDYWSNGVEQPVRVNWTPFYFQADIGSVIYLSVQSPPANWNFACSWDNYGHGSWSACQNAKTQVYAGPPDDKIAAFFDYTPPPPPPPQCSDGQYWNGQQCVCPSGQTWNGQQCVTPPPPPPPTNNCGGIGTVVSVAFGISPLSTNCVTLNVVGHSPSSDRGSDVSKNSNVGGTMYASWNDGSARANFGGTMQVPANTPVTFTVGNIQGGYGFVNEWDFWGCTDATGTPGNNWRNGASWTYDFGSQPSSCNVIAFFDTSTGMFSANPQQVSFTLQVVNINAAAEVTDAEAYLNNHFVGTTDSNNIHISTTAQPKKGQW